MAARLGADESARLLREPKAVELAGAVNLIVVRVPGQPRRYSLDIFRNGAVAVVGRPIPGRPISSYKGLLHSFPCTKSETRRLTLRRSDLARISYAS